jgi:predicted PhzF superfamily epimerase YddE/YHI9
VVRLDGGSEHERVPSYQLLNVFTAEDGSHGNPLGVFLYGSGFPDAQERQRVAADLGYSETVFVDDAATGELHIFTPASELPLAGHPLVGTAWLIAREHGSCDLLRPPAGDVPTWQDGDVRWIRARPEWAPEMELRQYDTAAEVEALDGPPDDLGFVDCWAWIDEQAGVLRSRVFVSDEGIPEDEATGAAALRIGAALARPLEIRQGKGSLLLARPGPDGTIEVGGRVVDRGEHGYGD